MLLIRESEGILLVFRLALAPFEVESALIEQEAVAEAAVIAKSDPVRNQIVKAFVVLAPGFESSESLATNLTDHVKTVTAPYKYPIEIEFLDDLPKTISGKISELSVKAAVEGKEIKNIDALANPDSLIAFKKLAKRKLTSQ